MAIEVGLRVVRVAETEVVFELLAPTALEPGRLQVPAKWEKWFAHPAPSASEVRER